MSTNPYNSHHVDTPIIYGIDPYEQGNPDASIPPISLDNDFQGYRWEVTTNGVPIMVPDRSSDNSTPLAASPHRPHAFMAGSNNQRRPRPRGRGHRRRGPLDPPDDSVSDTEEPRRIIQVVVPRRERPTGSSSNTRISSEENRRLHAAILQILHHSDQLSYEGRRALEEVLWQGGMTYEGVSEETIDLIRSQVRAPDRSQSEGRGRSNSRGSDAGAEGAEGESGHTSVLVNRPLPPSPESEQAESERVRQYGRLGEDLTWEGVRHCLGERLFAELGWVGEF
ncbi:hypothetical protein CB0940_06038 [Cercospora beticola]|uniref:Uncharacterized protein n=1 Tax=Cercospora beticola TaxID=122368 RepID=A0A2G5HZF9_CERBT|nr:hypothetical protein CB0940_06038 [Cercospora beticola]PIA97929.1 hypothetical protein CB0940_06038 [Cercospora beticola]WPA98650.1 hypothetical protein RHO25_003263 [Cercospora beticola]